MINSHFLISGRANSIGDYLANIDGHNKAVKIFNMVGTLRHYGLGGIPEEMCGDTVIIKGIDALHPKEQCLVISEIFSELSKYEVENIKRDVHLVINSPIAQRMVQSLVSLIYTNVKLNWVYFDMNGERTNICSSDNFSNAEMGYKPSAKAFQILESLKWSDWDWGHGGISSLEDVVELKNIVDEELGKC